MSGVVDEDTARTLAGGRETLGAVLSTAQRELQKVFLIFVAGFLLTFYALRIWIWDWLKEVTRSGMDLATAERVDIIVTTPFEVILLQAKLGILVGILVIIPALVYLSRRELQARGRWPDLRLSRTQGAGLILLATALFVGGVTYAYRVFFPIMFDFLASQAISVGVEPTYGIVDWTEFLILLTISFGLAAQLPLMMTGLAYTGIVPYETFRDKWKYAIIIMFSFGALFSPPDPFTLMMWATPLVGLYAFSLALAKVATNVRRAGEARVGIGSGKGIRVKLAGVGAAALLTGVAAVAFVVIGGPDWLWSTLVPRLPEPVRPGAPLGLSAFVRRNGQFGLLLVGVTATLLALAVPVIAYVFRALRRPVHPPVRPADPEAVDLTPANAEAIAEMPSAVFEGMDEETAVEYASQAVEAGDREKASLILDRFDDTHVEEDDSDAPPPAPEDETSGRGIQETATGVVGAFTDDHDEEEIGGYFHDLRFVADTLRSRLFHMFAVFGVVMGAGFTFLYQGGLGHIKQDFVSRLPAAVRPEELSVIALHPVEVLIFIVKASTILGALAVVPMILYYAWPALTELGWVDARRSVIYKWTAGTVLALIGGTMVGYFVIAPAVISYLVYDAINAGMIISYRINSFAWLIIFTTVGVGLLALIPFTMWMLYRAGAASYRAMRGRWREVTITAFFFAGMFTPAGVLSMFIVGIPVMIAYWVGLAGLWLVTLGGRRDGDVPAPAPSS